MKEVIEDLTAENRTIHTVAAYVQQFVDKYYQQVLDRDIDQLKDIFAQVGEPAYGAFGRALFQPILTKLAQAGIVCENGLPGKLQTSIERWGPPEDRERCLWSVISDVDGFPLGAIVTRLFHDHTQFRLPRPPRIFALEETDASVIVTGLSCAHVRLRGGEEYRGAFLQPTMEIREDGNWEYSVEIGLADGIERGRAELTEGLLDHALAAWGYYGWELTTVASHQGELIAFFKRPSRKNRSKNSK